VIAAWGVVHWILLGLSAVGIVGSLVARRRNIHAGLILGACSVFLFATASLTSSLVWSERWSTHLRKEIAVLSDPSAPKAAQTEAKDWADWNISEIGSRNIQSALGGLFFGLAGLYLVLAVTRPGTLLSAAGRSALTAEQARKGHTTHPPSTGTPA
jgi:hypothetical protein